MTPHCAIPRRARRTHHTACFALVFAATALAGPVLAQAPKRPAKTPAAAAAPAAGLLPGSLRLAEADAGGRRHGRGPRRRSGPVRDREREPRDKGPRRRSGHDVRRPRALRHADWAHEGARAPPTASSSAGVTWWPSGATRRERT